MPYHFPEAWDSAQRVNAVYLLEAGVRGGYSGADLVFQLQSMGLSYRRIEMLHDIRRAGAVAFARTAEDSRRAGQWFDSVFEPFRAANSMTANEASVAWDKTRSQTWDTLEEAEQGLDLMDRYEALA